jgi:hypothetical protein
MPWGVSTGAKTPSRARAGVQQPVGVHDEPADVRLLQDGLDALDVGAFREPDAARIAAEAAPVVVTRGEDLRADGGRVVQQRQQRVRGGGGDDFEAALLLKLAERADEVAAVGEVSGAQAREPVVIHPRELAELAVPVRAVDFLVGQFQQAFKMPHVAVLQERVQQHRAERGRERERQARLHALREPAFHHLHQREVSLRDRLEQPRLLQKAVVLRVPHKGQVRMEHESETALHGGD